MPSIAYNGRFYGINGANGKNVVVAKIEPIIGGNRVTFLYYDDNNVQQTSSLEVMNGERGVSVASAEVKENNELFITLSDGNEISAGFITIDPNSFNVNLDDYYTKTDINTLLENQKSYLESYIEEKVDEIVDEKVSETVDTVSSDDILNLFS